MYRWSLVKPDATSYRPELDGVRAIAVAAVVLAHAGAPLPGGHLGVDMFFVLSGYLIGGLLFRDLAQGRFSLTDFYTRRVRRILPALITVTAACLPAAWILLPPKEMELFGQGLVALTSFATNILFWLNAGYFAPNAATNPLIHTWSLAVEEQFYLLFPLGMLLLWRHCRLQIGWVLGGIGLFSLIAFAMVWELDQDTAFYLLPFRVWELMAGALVAWVCHHRRVSSRGSLAAAGLAMTIAALAMGSAHSAHAWVWSLCATSGTVLLVLFARPGTVVARSLALRPVSALGLISYSTYLWHQPVLAFARMAQIEPLSTIQLVGLVIAILAMAWATWAWIEQPWRNTPPRRLRGLAMGGAVALGFAGLGLAADVTSGLGVQRFSPSKQHIFASAEPSPERANCHGSAKTFHACVYGADTAPGWAVLGDSHAVELAYVLGEGLALKHEAVLHISASGCRPTPGSQDINHPCANWFSQALARIAAEPDIHTVVLAWRHGLYVHGGGGNRQDRPDQEAVGQAYLDAMDMLISQLDNMKIKTVFVASVPELHRDVGLYTLHASAGIEDVPALPRRVFDERMRAVDKRIPTHASKVLRPASVLCDAVWCYAAKDGEAIYFDDDHLSLAGARRVVAPLLAENRGEERGNAAEGRLPR